VINFNIVQWRAWAPGLESAEDWQAWSRQPVAPQRSEAAPDVSFLPAMQRRRLSRLARMAFSVGWPLADGRADLPLVFISRHGETPRTFDILSDLAAAGDGLEHGMLEAAALLAEGAPAVLLVITEEQPPEAYSDWIDDVPFPYAVGLLLTPGNDWQLSLNSTPDTLSKAHWPHALNLLPALLGQHTTCQHAWKNRVWTWQRNP